MTAGRKTDAETRAKVIFIKLKEPKKSAREVGKEVNIPRSTAQEIIQREFGKLGSEEEMLEAIKQKDLENIALGATLISKEVSRRVNFAEKGLPVEIKEMAGVMGDATKRRQLMTGGATENVAVGVKTFLPEKEK